MAFSITQAFRVQYDDAWNLETQQLIAKLAGTVHVDTGVTAKEKWYKDLSRVSFTENNSRFGKTNAKEAEIVERRLAKRRFEAAIKFDRGDKEFLENMHLPDSEVMESMRAAWKRSVDDLILEAATADIYVSPREAPTLQSLPASQSVAVNYVPTGSPANSGITPWKILFALQKLEDADVDIANEDLTLAITPRNKLEMQQYVAQAPTDKWAGIIGDWLANPSGKLFGCSVVTSTRLPFYDSANDIRFAYLYSKKAFTVAPEKMETHIDILPGERHSIQIAAYADYGALRRYDERIVAIRCDQSP